MSYKGIDQVYRSGVWQNLRDISDVNPGEYVRISKSPICNQYVFKILKNDSINYEFQIASIKEIK